MKGVLIWARQADMIYSLTGLWITIFWICMSLARKSCVVLWSLFHLAVSDFQTHTNNHRCPRPFSFLFFFFSSSSHPHSTLNTPPTHSPPNTHIQSRLPCLVVIAIHFFSFTFWCLGSCMHLFPLDCLHFTCQACSHAL